MKVIRGITLVTIVLLSIGVQTGYAQEGDATIAEPISDFFHADSNNKDTAWVPISSAVVLRRTAPCTEILLTRYL